MAVQAQINAFSDGMNLDLHPLTAKNTLLTDNLNGTFLTYNGNDMMLQNDMGNYKLEGCNLADGFIPVGLTSYSGILYIMSYNPITRETELGSFPSPKRTATAVNAVTEDDAYTACELMTDAEIAEKGLGRNLYLSQLGGTKYAIPSTLNDYYLNPGDKYALELKDITSAQLKYQSLNFYILTESKQIIPIDRRLVTYYSDISNITRLADYSKVAWETAGWLMYNYVLATLHSSNMYLSRVANYNSGNAGVSTVNYALSYDVASNDYLFLDGSGADVDSPLLSESNIKMCVLVGYYNDDIKYYCIEGKSHPANGTIVDNLEYTTELDILHTEQIVYPSVSKYFYANSDSSNLSTLIPTLVVPSWATELFVESIPKLYFDPETTYSSTGDPEVKYTTSLYYDNLCSESRYSKTYSGSDINVGEVYKYTVSETGVTMRMSIRNTLLDSGTVKFFIYKIADTSAETYSLEYVDTIKNIEVIQSNTYEEFVLQFPFNDYFKVESIYFIMSSVALTQEDGVLEYTDVRPLITSTAFNNLFDSYNNFSEIDSQVWVSALDSEKYQITPTYVHTSEGGASITATSPSITAIEGFCNSAYSAWDANIHDDNWSKSTESLNWEYSWINHVQEANTTLKVSGAEGIWSDLTYTTKASVVHTDTGNPIAEVVRPCSFTKQLTENFEQFEVVNHYLYDYLPSKELSARPKKIQQNNIMVGAEINEQESPMWSDWKLNVWTTPTVGGSPTFGLASNSSLKTSLVSAIDEMSSSWAGDCLPVGMPFKYEDYGYRKDLNVQISTSQYGGNWMSTKIDIKYIVNTSSTATDEYVTMIPVGYNNVSSNKIYFQPEDGNYSSESIFASGILGSTTYYFKINEDFTRKNFPGGHRYKNDSGNVPNMDEELYSGAKGELGTPSYGICFPSYVVGNDYDYIVIPSPKNNDNWDTSQWVGFLRAWEWLSTHIYTQVLTGGSWFLYANTVSEVVNTDLLFDVTQTTNVSNLEFNWGGLSAADFYTRLKSAQYTNEDGDELYLNMTLDNFPQGPLTLDLNTQHTYNSLSLDCSDLNLEDTEYTVSSFEANLNDVYKSAVTTAAEIAAKALEQVATSITTIGGREFKACLCDIEDATCASIAGSFIGGTIERNVSTGAIITDDATASFKYVVQLYTKTEALALGDLQYSQLADTIIPNVEFFNDDADMNGREYANTVYGVDITNKFKNGE